MDETFLLQCRPLLSFLEQIYKIAAFTTWQDIRQAVPPNFGLFGTIFTTIVVNTDAGMWHYDPLDTGFTILIYFGDYREGELLLGKPVNLKIPTACSDIVLLKSQNIYHKSLPFKGDRVSFAIYSSKVKNKDCNIIDSQKRFLK